MKTPWASTRGRRAGGIGPLSSPVLLVAEALGKDEEALGEPLIGASGRFLFEGKVYGQPSHFPGLNHLGLPRNEVRIENVVELRPPDNVLQNLSPHTVLKWQEDFWRRFEKCSPTVVVPNGNLALNTLRRAPLPLTKKGKWKLRSTPQGKQIDWRDKITNWRGSIFWVKANNGAKVKCIPTYHPAYVLRAGDSFDVWQGDWQRILGDMHFPELRLGPKAEHFIEPTPKDAHAFEMLVQQHYLKDPKHAVLAVDIETLAGGKMVDCIGFSVEETFSMTFNLREKWAWVVVTRLLAHPIAKGWHYGLYDCYILGQKGKEIANTRWDSQQMHHCLDPRDEHRLAYCASRDLRVRYWKHENKEEGKDTTVKDPRKRWRYNGKDAAFTRALIERYREQLKGRGLLTVYRDHYRELTAACLDLTRTGFRADDKVRREIEQREKALLVQLRGEMQELAGTDLVAKGGGLSSPKVNAYFYDTLKCKPFYRRGTSNRTADELAIRRLMHKYKKARPGGKLILGYREHAKIRQEVRETLVDDDGRLRSRYSPTTKTHRLRAMKVSEEKGINAQNRDRHSDLRRMFVADRGQVLVEVDQSQGESRIVDGMSGDPALLKLARLLPTEKDLHILNACKIFDLSYDDLHAAYKAGDKEADEKRQLGKRVRHAANYGMGGMRMAEMAMVETEGRLVLDPDECDAWLEKMMDATPGLVRYHEWIRQQMIEDGCLPSSWGLPYYFKGLRLTKEHFKEGYARPPQHEVGVLTNQRAFKPARNYILSGGWPGANIVQQGHDSLITTTPPKYAYEIAKFQVESMGEKRTYPGASGPWTLSMPIGVKVGLNWKDMTEWKELPTKEEFERCLSSLF